MTGAPQAPSTSGAGWPVTSTRSPTPKPSGRVPTSSQRPLSASTTRQPGTGSASVPVTVTGFRRSVGPDCGLSGGGVTDSGTGGFGLGNGSGTSGTGGVVEVDGRSGSAGVVDVDGCSGSAGAFAVEGASDELVPLPVSWLPPHAAAPSVSSTAEPSSTRIRNPPRVTCIGRMCRPGRFPTRATRRAVVLASWGRRHPLRRPPSPYPSDIPRMCGAQRAENLARP
jgi:hypothetical protein